MSKPTNLKPFAPGQSGNPGGRPRLPDDVKALARGYTREAIETAAEIMRDPEETGTARMSAINTILDRGWGKAPQHVTVDSLEGMSDAELRAELLATVAELRQNGLDAEDHGSAAGDDPPPRTH
ncbi:DUF5681 domain-containing protein [Methylobacterium sp. E-046]|uniref:DUF5681 domain-containing protein n=1 Tax=Methylobacterium sp. E-046 TaxID=2836576 RepID=UPI001FBAD61A|nr:DUF5681 domain-containing protein [Methylobacterium sp. E-046]MCJ2101973.1 hypothetical protein [Methylobacterium sp. E-046]